jgi:hypothetical protein
MKYYLELYSFFFNFNLFLKAFDGGKKKNFNKGQGNKKG